jgi:hypothetical protein
VLCRFGVKRGRWWVKRTGTCDRRSRKVFLKRPFYAATLVSFVKSTQISTSRGVSPCQPTRKPSGVSLGDPGSDEAPPCETVTHFPIGNCQTALLLSNSVLRAARGHHVTIYERDHCRRSNFELSSIIRCTKLLNPQIIDVETAARIVPPHYLSFGSFCFYFW